MADVQHEKVNATVEGIDMPFYIQWTSKKAYEKIQKTNNNWKTILLPKQGNHEGMCNKRIMEITVK